MSSWGQLACRWCRRKRATGSPASGGNASQGCVRRCAAVLGRAPGLGAASWGGPVSANGGDIGALIVTAVERTSRNDTQDEAAHRQQQERWVGTNRTTQCELLLTPGPAPVCS